MGCHPGENGIYIMNYSILNHNELLSFQDFVKENPKHSIVLIPSYAGIGVNYHVLIYDDFRTLLDKFGSNPIPYKEYSKVGKDITDYESW